MGLNCATCNTVLLQDEQSTSRYMTMVKNYYCVQQADRWSYLCEDCHAPALKRCRQKILLTQSEYEREHAVDDAPLNELRLG